ncbi:hypothetical protein DIPPA_12996 [Diplonema papillatum]|nr:hypothetical protein DIPPA_12996 [Diplonema papillatum]
MPRALVTGLLLSAFAGSEVTASSPAPPINYAPCGQRPYGRLCTEGAELDVKTSICTCVQEGFACDVSYGLCRKLKVTSDDDDGPSGGAVFGFVLVLLLFGFCVGLSVFYSRAGRLPHWFKNACCSCPPSVSCQDKSSDSDKKKNTPGIHESRSSEQRHSLARTTSSKRFIYSSSTDSAKWK